MFVHPPACTCDPPIKDGYEFNHYIGEWFGDCVRTPSEMASFTNGMISLGCFVVALFPQLWLNFKRKSCDGLSWGLILMWAFGDVCNLAGTLLTNQLATQVYLAAFFVLIDFAILFQFFWYTSWRVKLMGVHPREGSDRQPLLPPHTGEEVNIYGSTETPTMESEGTRSSQNSGPTGTATAKHVAIAVAGVVMLCSGLVDGQTFPGTSISPLVTVEGLRLCNERVPTTAIGTILGSLAAWTSGFLYFTSRIPQIRTNFEKKSVEGLSIALFFYTLLGNLTYGISVILRVAAFDTIFLTSEFPFLLGSTGVLIFDLTIMYQAYIYRKK